MKRFICAVFCLVMLAVISTSHADSPILSGYSMDEITEGLFGRFDLDGLQELSRILDEEIMERQRQWALEHANRKVTFEQSEIILYKGKSIKVTPIVTRMSDDAPQKTSFVWSSDNPSVAKYNGTSISAVGQGTAVLTCTATDDDAVTGSITVTVVLPVKQVKVEAATDKLMVGASPEKACTDLTAVITPEDAYFNGVTWTSSNESIASVDQNGHVQAYKAGHVTITATTNDGSSAYPPKGTRQLTITQAITGIDFSEYDITVGAGKTYALKATIEPKDATNKRLDWSSTDKSIAYYSEGRIVGKNPGTCIITAEANDGSGVIVSCKVTVIKQINSVQFVNTAPLTMSAGEKLEITLKILPDDATNKRMTWESSDNEVASVSSSGVITAKKVGSCSITATTTDGTAKKATIKITVYPSIQELVNGKTWYYNGGSDTTLNSISFTETSVTVKQVHHTGNGVSFAGSLDGSYSTDNGMIKINLDNGKKLEIPYSVKKGTLLSFGNGEYFTIEEVEKALQGYWCLKESIREVNVYINRGNIKYESASIDITGRVYYWYYGPYSGTYSLVFGGFNTTLPSDGVLWGWNIINGKPTMLVGGNVMSPARKLPGQNGYRF